MAVVKLKSEKRIKQVVTSGGGAENANTYESGDLVYSTSDDTLKQSNATNWLDVPVHPITKLYITNNGDTHYVFNGPGFDATANSNTGDRNPTIYLVRGQKYQFENLLGSHPFRISSSDGGGAYSDGITNNDVSNGALEWNVMHDVPNTMYYNCTSHAAMKGQIKIVDAAGGSATDLAIANQSATTLRITSSTGNNADVPLADTSNAGLMSKAQFDKLAGIATSASATLVGLSDTPANFTGHANKFVKVNDAGSGNGDAIEFVNVNVPGNLADLSNVDAFAGGNADQGKLAVVKESADAIDFIPLHAFHEITVAHNAGSNTAITTELNSSLGGTIIIKNTGNNSSGTASAKCVQVNVASLTAHKKSKPRFEIMTGLANVGFRFKADTTVIDAFGGGQAQIAAGVGDTDGLSVSDSQKLVLMCVDGTNWKYMVQSI